MKSEHAKIVYGALSVACFLGYWRGKVDFEELPPASVDEDGAPEDGEAVAEHLPEEEYEDEDESPPEESCADALDGNVRSIKHCLVSATFNDRWLVSHGAPVSTLIIEDCAFEAGFSVSGAKLDRVLIKGSTFLDSAALKNGGSFYLSHVDLRRLEIEASSFGGVEIENITSKPLLEVKGSSFRRVEVANATFTGMEIVEGVQVGVGRAADAKATDADFILRHVAATQLELEGSSLGRFDFTDLTVGGSILLTNATWVYGELNHVRVYELSVKGARGPKGANAGLDLMSSAIEHFDVTAESPAQVLWQGGNVATFHHDGGLRGVMEVLERQGQATSASAYRALERSAREEGAAYLSNKIRARALLHQTSDEESSMDSSIARARRIYLDGRGHPLLYVLVLLGLVLAAAAFFHPAPGLQHPPHVKPTNPPADTTELVREGADKWLVQRKPREGTTSTPAYNAFLMGLATLLPGDLTNYLRNFRFEPQSNEQAIGVTLLQIAALLTQGLVVFSVLSLLGGR